MAAFSQYEGPSKIQANGRTLAEALSSTLTIDGGKKPVLTMHRGLAGFSSGPIQGTCEIEQAVPKRGFEGAFLEALMAGTEMELTVMQGGKRITVPAVINGWELRNGVDTSAGVRTSWIVGPPVIR